MALNENELSEPGRAILDASRNSIAQAWLKGIVGAAIGTAAGWYLFNWLTSQNFYGLALPGACVGIGFALLSRRRMISGGIFCAIVALALTITCEWHQSAFKKDPSLSYFVSHLHQLDHQITYVMFALNSIFAFWFGKGR